MTTRQPTPGVHENFAADVAETKPQPLGYITPAALEQLRTGIDCQPIHKDTRHGFTVPIFDHPPRTPEADHTPSPQSHVAPLGWATVRVEDTCDGLLINADDMKRFGLRDDIQYKGHFLPDGRYRIAIPSPAPEKHVVQPQNTVAVDREVLRDIAQLLSGSMFTFVSTEEKARERGSELYALLITRENQS